MNAYRFPLVLVLVGLSGILAAADPAPATAADPELPKKAEAAMLKGAEFLLAKVNADGSVGTYHQPAFAALAAMALYGCPLDPAKRTAAVDKLMTFVTGFLQPDNSIQAPGRRIIFWRLPSYPNYSTALAVLAMVTVNKPEYLPILKKAREYLKSTQEDDAKSPGYGGIGYGPGKRPDLSNTTLVAEALYATEYLDREPQPTSAEVGAKNKEMWTNLTTFLDKCQKQADPKAAADKVDTDVGGFAYLPAKGEASALVTSGSMTYAALKTMIYANLTREDPRVKGAMNYLGHHYTLDENPGSGQKGKYYYLVTMTKALNAYGQDTLVLGDGTKCQWRQDLIATLLALQRPNGSWYNDEGRLMESMPELVTAYCLVSLRIALGPAPAEKKQRD